MQTRQPYGHRHVPAIAPRRASPGGVPGPRGVPSEGGAEAGEAPSEVRTVRRDQGPTGVVEEFVSFCRRRRRVGWPELYDEMCAVAGRGLFRGWGLVELAEQGIGFTLADMPRLAAIVEEVVRAERASSSITASTAGAAGTGAATGSEVASVGDRCAAFRGVELDVEGPLESRLPAAASA